MMVERFEYVKSTMRTISDDGAYVDLGAHWFQL